MLGVAIGLIMAATIDVDDTFIAFMVLLISIGALLSITLVNSILWSTTLYHNRALKYIAAPLLVVTGWLALLALVLVYNQVLAYFAFGGGGIAGSILFLAVAIGVVVLNLFAIHRYRQ